jgi:glycosyltransferase involved in cell wall biosynthesis
MWGDTHAGSYSPRPFWKRAARKVILGNLFRQTAAALAISSPSAAFYRAFGVPNDHIFLVPYAVDNDFFTEQRERLLPARQELRRALGVVDSRPIIVSSGKLLDRKAPLDLLHAFAAVRKEVCSKLVYLGDGELRHDVENLARELGINEDVHITGFQQQDSMCKIYTAADVMVFPSHFDVWGVVVNEGMLFDLAIICSNGVGAHSDLIVEGETGQVYPAGNVAELARVLRIRLLDSEGSLRMGKKGRQRVLAWNFNRGVESTVKALNCVCPIRH